MKTNLNLVNLGIKGHGIARTAKACRKEVLTNAGIIIGSLPALVAGIYYENLLLTGVFGTSIGISTYDSSKAIELYSNIKPKYKEIKKRAKSIYNK